MTIAIERDIIESAIRNIVDAADKARDVRQLALSDRLIEISGPLVKAYTEAMEAAAKPKGADFPRLQNWFRAAREQIGQTQQQIADATGMNAPIVSFWESGEICPPMKIAARLAKAYAVPHDKVVTEIHRQAAKIADRQPAHRVPA